jgi:dihydroorotase
MKKVIVGGLLMDPGINRTGYFDIVLEGEKIFSVVPHEERIWSHDIKQIDARNKLVVPGFIDLHVHLREPGYEHKETIESGTYACAKGGFTTVACMPNTNPAIDSIEKLVDLETRIQKSARIDVKPIAAITKGIAGEELTDHVGLYETGVLALSDDGRTTMNRDFMKVALKNADKYGRLIITHCEDHELTDQYKDSVYPIEAETNIVIRDINLAKESNANLHIAHVSGKDALKEIAKAKAEGVAVTCEVTPHHFGLNDTLVDVLEPRAKVNPPIRSEEHRMALVKGIREGVIDIIATDHAPHDQASKTGKYSETAFGISGAETAFSIAYEVLVRSEEIPLMRVIEMLTCKPAEVFGLKNVGSIQEGYMGDLVLIDLEKSYRINSDQFVSKGKNTPFEGKLVHGVVEMTIFRGNIVYERELLYAD